MSMLTRCSIVTPAILIALTLAGCAANSAPTSARKDLIVNNGWKFIRQDPSNAQSPQFDDTQWLPVSLPHTWNALDGQDGGANYYRGPCWYRIHLPITAADLQNQIYLRFEAASLVSQVWINGQLAGTHWGGFAAFCFNVTPHLHPGDNLLAVRVDNSRNLDLPPLSGDFTVFGGLYRNVHLLMLNPICISPTDDASPGIYLKPVKVDGQSAQIDITTELRNDLNDEKTITADCSIQDADGRSVAETKVRQSIPAHSTAEAHASLIIDHPHLWNGRPDPYLYHAAVELTDQNKILDRVVQPLGLRFFHVDPQQGFFLNGHHYPLYGVSRHQDHLNQGWATTPDDIDQDYRLINELACTAVRLPHYQHPDYEYSLCDRDGIAVWAELALVNRIGDSPRFADNARQQLRELIKQNYNHPSIFFWSLFNELGPHTRINWQLVTDLNELSHSLDPDRITVAASHLPPEIAVNWIPDIIAFNRYLGWYTTTIADWPRELDKLHAYHPDRAIGISEYGAGASIYQHQDHLTRQPSTKGNWHPEEWQATVHEAAYRAMKERPWLWGSFIWVMFDFAADDRNEGDHPGRNDKGLVTADRLTKKDAFYFYKANWSTDPFVYITSRRYNPRPPGPTDLKVYSNCDTVTLTLNGQSLGQRTSPDHIFLWRNVKLREGQYTASATGEKNSKAYTDTCPWTVSESAATTKPTTSPD